ncbi:FG-GAP-like repeat-containing protein [Streptomyces rubiginosohelvolus]|uniref:FG-GAP-like repeat-containing protein n=1 Tax=Streptomyces rubiginosohelvolus TaxID=67362 RepID=UPI0033B07569
MSAIPSRLLWGTTVAAALATVVATAPATALNGSQAPAQLNFVAKINVGEQSACTGTLVAPQWVLTASTCFSSDGAPSAGKPAVATTVTVGRVDLTQAGGSVQQAVDLVPHPNRDLTLVQLAKAITDPAIRPVRVSTTPAAQGEELTKAGFGRTKTEWVPKKLHTGVFSVASTTDTSVNLTGSDTATVCKGDAGGPALRTVNGTPELVGVSSRSGQAGCLGIDPANVNTSALDTRVDDLGPWITMATGARWGQAAERAAASQELSGDFDGDGKTDTALLHTYSPAAGGVRHAALWKFTSTAAGTYNPVRAWDNLVAGPTSWDAERSKAVAGDFNGDGKADIAILYNNGQNTDGTFRTTLWTFLSNGTGFDAPVVKWSSGTSSWNWDRLEPFAGDFDGDGKADIGVLYDIGTAADGRGVTRLWTFTSNGDSFNAPAVKWTSTTSWSWDRSLPVPGDFNGDGKTDVAILYNNGQSADGRSQTRLWTLSSNGAGFTAPVEQWFSGTTSWDWTRSKPFAGDYNGDGKADVGVLYDIGTASDGSGVTRLWTFTSNGDGFAAPAVKWTSSFSWAWGRSLPVPGDFNGDGKTDLHVLYDYGQRPDNSYRAGMWRFTSTGSTFTNPLLIWDSSNITP